jgi:hypothetical protein
MVTFSNDPISWVLLLLGFSLIAEGTWICIKPSPMGILVDGIFLLIIGIWNIVVTVNDFILWSQFIRRNPLSYVSSPSTVFIIIGMWQIVWFVSRVKRFRRFSGKIREKPSEETINKVDAITDSIKNVKFDESNDLIEFTGAGTNWKGRLFGNIVVLVGVEGLILKSVNDAAFIRREDMQIVDQGRYRLSRFRRVQVRMGTRSFSGLMSPKSLQRYELVWKAAPMVFPPPPPPPPPDWHT